MNLWDGVSFMLGLGRSPDRRRRLGTKRKYTVLMGFCIGDAQNVWPGETVELGEREAQEPLFRGWIAPLGRGSALLSKSDAGTMEP